MFSIEMLASIFIDNEEAFELHKTRLRYKQSINISSLNSMTSLFSFQECGNYLTKLSLFRCPISSLDGIEKLTKLNTLTMEECPITEIKIKSELLNLELMRFFRCNIDKIEGLNYLPKLNCFNLTYIRKSDNLIKYLLSNSIDVVIHYREIDTEFYYKTNPYKLSYCCFDGMLKSIILYRMRRSRKEILESSSKSKLLSIWFSYLYQRVDDYGYNRFSYLAFYLQN